MLHVEAHTVSYKHRLQIKKGFTNILGMYGIQHFCLKLARPDGQLLFFSSTPSHDYEICTRGYAGSDGIIAPAYYQNYEFYWWKDAHHKAFAKDIDRYREGVLGLKHGFMLVRKWNDFHFMYSFATKSPNTFFEDAVLKNLNEFLKLGDQAYMRLRNLYANYCGRFEPPIIEQFYPYIGGMPPARYTRDFPAHNMLINRPPNNKVIVVDFMKKI